jgi:hypothetical protein
MVDILLQYGVGIDREGVNPRDVDCSWNNEAVKAKLGEFAETSVVQTE